MRTQRVTTIALDEARLAKDLDVAAGFHYSEAYSNYLIGGPWKSSMLWCVGGETGDGVMTNYAYDRRADFTEAGRQLPYLQEIITGSVDLSRLNFVRLAVLSDSVIVPHRDLLELSEIADENRIAHRLHIPLVTHDECFFDTADVVYRMAPGEVWFFDASAVHSVASFSAEPRIHLIFDFVDRPDAGMLVTLPGAVESGQIPAERIVTRPSMPPATRASIMGLAPLLSMDTVKEVFAVVIKKQFRFDGGENFAWDAMTAIARVCSDPAVLPHVLEMRRYFELERSA